MKIRIRSCNGKTPTNSLMKQRKNAPRCGSAERTSRIRRAAKAARRTQGVPIRVWMVIFKENNHPPGFIGILYRLFGSERAAKRERYSVKTLPHRNDPNAHRAALRSESGESKPPGQGRCAWVSRTPSHKGKAACSTAVDPLNTDGGSSEAAAAHGAATCRRAGRRPTAEMGG